MYEAYFGFRHAPFGVTPDPRFLFRNPRYEEALSTLLYGIRERKGFVLLTGEVGTGKTTLLHTAIAELGATPFVFVFNPVADFDQLLTLVCDELGLAPERTDRPARLAVLNLFLTDQMRAGRTTALLIDEGQNLTAQTLEDLRLLSNLEIPTEKLLQIVLVGQPELAARLDEPSLRQLRQRVALRYELTALTEREVGDFVRHRLLTVGAPDENLIERDAVSKIARLSGGIPRLVNMICDNALLICYGSSQRKVTSAIVDEVAGDLRLAGPASRVSTSPDESRSSRERVAPQSPGPGAEALPAFALPLDESRAAKALVAILGTLRLRHGAVLRYDSVSQTLTLVAQQGLAEQAIDAMRFIRRDASGVWDMPLHAVLQRRVYIIGKPNENPFVPTLLPSGEHEPLNAVVMPLFAAGAATGAILLVGSGKRIIHESDVLALREAARDLGAALRPPAKIASRAPYGAPPAARTVAGSGYGIAGPSGPRAGELESPVERGGKVALEWKREKSSGPPAEAAGGPWRSSNRQICRSRDSSSPSACASPRSATRRAGNRTNNQSAPGADPLGLPRH
jgi:general secretion pathway protein A